MLSPFRLSSLFISGLLALLCVASAHAQQSEQSKQLAVKPDATITDSLPPPAKDFPQEEIPSVPVFASRLTEILSSVKCHDKKDCTIFVADFVSPEGYTSSYGLRLADELSAELARQKSSIPVADRALLGRHLRVLREERVPADLQRSPSVMRWLGNQLNASVVLVGEIESHTSNMVQLSAHFLNVKDQKLKSPTAGVALPLPASLEELSASDPLPPLPLRPETVNGERVYHPGEQGVEFPKCHYMPNPPYTDEARKFKLSGSLVLEAIVDTHGTVRNPRIVRGLPFGLNEIATQTISTWKCNPATLEGQPVSTYVPFEVTFRLY